MRDHGLKDYYEQELRYLRELGAEFADQHEEIASALRLADNQSDDPHVERLLEGVAFLAARVHRRIDDDFSEICQSLLNVIYPHYLRPIPAVSVVHLQPEPGAPASGFRIPRGSTLVAPPADGVRCRFRTCYDTAVWPLRVADAGWTAPSGLDLGTRTRDVAAVLRLVLESTSDAAFADLELDRLRLYLDGDLPLVSTLYELLDNNCIEILVRDRENGDRVTVLPGRVLRPIGFEEDEGLLPNPGRAFLGYRLLVDYFAFPQKYLFLELGGLERLRDLQYGSSVEFLFLIRPYEDADRQQVLERSVDRDTVRLGCTPVVNLFEAESEPIRLNQRRPEYLVRARGPREHPYEVFSVDEVSAVMPDPPRRVPFAPFFAYRHREQNSEHALYWHARRFPSTWLEGAATDVSLAFVDVGGQTLHPEYPSAMARLTVFNGELPNRLAIGRDKGDLDLEGGGAPLKRVHFLIHPNRPIQPPLDGSVLWRLVSQLSLNYLSLTDGDGAALRELLRLYNLGGYAAGYKHIRGITAVESEPWFARVRSGHGLSFARGRRVRIEFDEDEYSGGGIYLLASILERMLAQYSSMNSFSALRAEVRSQNKTYTLREWKPRAGVRPLV
jgi:type VI secretion system protein ImpG